MAEALKCPAGTNEGQKAVTRFLPSRTVRAIFPHTALHRISPAGRVLSGDPDAYANVAGVRPD